MVETKRKEELSKSYLNAICAYVGVAMEVQAHDDDSIDVMLKKKMTRNDGSAFEAQLGVQLKSTSKCLTESANAVSYELKAKNYNDLKALSTVQKLLFVLILPEEEKEWITHSVDELVIRRCMYWISLESYPNSDNTSSITVQIPKIQYLDAEALQRLMQDVAEERRII